MGPFGRIPGSELSGLRSHSSGSPPSCSHSSLPSKSDLQVWLVQRASTLAQVDNGSRPSSARRLRGCYVRRRPRSAATKDWFAAVHVRARRCLKLSVRTLRRRSSATRGAAPLVAAGDSTLRRRTVIQGQTAVAGYRGSS